MSESVLDEPLRIRALEVLGALGDVLAHETLEACAIAVEHDVRTWESSHGTVRAHRVVVRVPAELYARVAANHPARDSLAAALSAAMSERGGHSVADVRIELGARESSPGGPYRVPSR